MSETKKVVGTKGVDMAECLVCKEKQVEIDRILAAFEKINKFNRKKDIVLGSLIVLMAAFGRDGIEMFMEFVKGIFVK